MTETNPGGSTAAYAVVATTTYATAVSNVAVGMVFTNTYGYSALIAKSLLFGPSLLAEYNA